MKNFKEWLKSKRWHHLGYTEIRWTNKEGEQTSRCTIHYFGWGKLLNRRKVIVHGWPMDEVKEHTYYQQSVIEWLYKGNLWKGIAHPSEYLREYTEKTSNYRYDWQAKEWKRIRPTGVEGNVVAFPSKDAS